MESCFFSWRVSSTGDDLTMPSLRRKMSSRDPRGWIPSPGPWVPPSGVKPGDNWTPGRYGARPRTEVMPLWVRIWFRTPFLDRRARVYMWHHGFWAVPPTVDWEDFGPGSVGRPLRRSRIGALRLRVARRRKWHFGIRWSAIIHILVCLVTALVGAFIWGWFGAVMLAVFGEGVLAAISLFAGRNLR